MFIRYWQNCITLSSCVEAVPALLVTRKAWLVSFFQNDGSFGTFPRWVGPILIQLQWSTSASAFDASLAEVRNCVGGVAAERVGIALLASFCV